MWEKIRISIVMKFELTDRFFRNSLIKSQYCTMHFVGILIYVFTINFYTIIMIRFFYNINNNVFKIKRITYFRIHLVSCDLGNTFYTINSINFIRQTPFLFSNYVILSIQTGILSKHKLITLIKYLSRIFNKPI